MTLLLDNREEATGLSRCQKFFEDDTIDANGNILSDNGYLYHWDAENRLIRVNAVQSRPSTQADNITMEYDGLGRRVRILEKHGDTVLADKRLLWVDSQIAEERASNGSTVNKRYFDQGYTLTSGSNLGSYFYAKDHLGSIREVTDSSGAVRARYDYDLWGRRTKLEGDLNSDFGFTGFYRNEASELDLTWYRAYSAEMGRWLSRDPIGEFYDSNTYRYVRNNILGLIDLLGLAASPIPVPNPVPTPSNAVPRYYPVPGDNYNRGNLAGVLLSNMTGCLVDRQLGILTGPEFSPLIQTTARVTSRVSGVISLQLLVADLYCLSQQIPPMATIGPTPEDPPKLVMPQPRPLPGVK